MKTKEKIKYLESCIENLAIELDECKNGYKYRTGDVIEYNFDDGILGKGEGTGLIINEKKEVRDSYDSKKVVNYYDIVIVDDTESFDWNNLLKGKTLHLIENDIVKVIKHLKIFDL
jgi:hypothetical protein